MPDRSTGSDARMATALSFAARYAGMVLRTLNLLILARLLAPEAFGSYATAATLAALVYAVTEGGLHNYLIQRPRFRRADIEACLGVATTLAVSGAAILVALAAAAPSAWLPEEARDLLPVLALTILLPPVALPVAARLQRRLRFDLLLWIDVVRTAASVAVSIGLAAWGAGAMALAAGAVADVVAGVGLTLWLGRGRGVVLPRLKGWRPVVGFATPFAAVGVLGRAGDAGVTLIIGHAQGLAAVGVFNRAMVIHEIADRAFTQALGPVLLPVLSRAQRRGRDLSELYLRKVAGLTGVLWPFYAVLAVLAEPIVAIVLGPGWHEAAGVVRALAAIGLALPFVDLSFKFFIALGGSRTYAVIQGWAIAIRLIAVAALVMVSLPAAVLGIALAMALRALAITLWIKRRLHLPWRPFLLRCARGAAITAASLIGPVALALTADGPVAPGRAMLGIVLAACGWSAALLVLRHELAEELRKLAVLLRERLAARSAQAAVFPIVRRRT